MSATARKIAAEDVIQTMKDLGLTPPAALKPEDKEFPRIVGATVDEIRKNGKFFWDVVLDVQWAPGADPAPFVIRSNIGSEGAIALVTIDEKVVFVRQWRVNLGRYTWEVSRGFSEDWDSGNPTSADTLPGSLKTAIREAEEEMETADLKSKVVAHHIGKVAENSGTHCGSPDYWLLEMNGYELDPANTSVKAVSAEEAISIVEDSHSATALLLLVRRHLVSRK